MSENTKQKALDIIGEEKKKARDDTDRDGWERLDKAEKRIKSELQ